VGTLGVKIYGESGRNSGVPTPRLALDDGGVHLGIWIVTRDPLVVDIVSAESFDWISVDAQHGGPEIDEVQRLIEGAHLFGVPSIVRVPGHDSGTICRVVDADAGGLIFPTV
jgi:4-hydroxy-2-oxoheptanedioate aldolase